MTIEDFRAKFSKKENEKEKEEKEIGMCIIIDEFILRNDHH